jgi:uncharacterized damage-inducible protein DinB
MASAAPEQQTFYDGWANYHRLLLDSLRDLTADQLLLKPAANLWAVWQLTSHMAASRTYWFHVLGEGDPALRDLFRVQSTTVPAWRSRTPPGRTTRITRADRPRSSRVWNAPGR